jgi:hypothetical protein
MQHPDRASNDVRGPFARGDAAWAPRVLGLALAVAAAAGGPALAEVAAEPMLDGVGVVILGVIEGPDPIPQVIWSPVGGTPPALVLNPDGALRGDGRPDVAIDPITQWPHVVWAWRRGAQHDIAYSRWDGSGWTAPSFLTGGLADEIDPRVFVDANAVHVVWWEPASKAIRLTLRPRTGSWGLTETVVGHTGMRPSVATWGGTLLVASEKASALGGKTIHLSTRLAPNAFSTVALWATPESQPLDVVLHVEQGTLWADWRQSATKFAYAVHGGWAWTPPAPVSWPDPSWLGFAQARLVIRGLVLGSP